MQGHCRMVQGNAGVSAGCGWKAVGRDYSDRRSRISSLLSRDWRLFFLLSRPLLLSTFLRSTPRRAFISERIQTRMDLLLLPPSFLVSLLRSILPRLSASNLLSVIFLRSLKGRSCGALEVRVMIVHSVAAMSWQSRRIN